MSAFGRPVPDYRRQMLAKVHIAKKDLGLDDDTYRAALVQVTGHNSAGKLNNSQLADVLKVFKQRGFTASMTKRDRTPGYGESKFLPKIRALWLSAWELGIVRDKSDKAMEQFIARQTGIASARWLNYVGDAAKVIEALKKWMVREGKVNFTMRRFDHVSGSTYVVDPREAVVWAQFAELERLGAFKGFAGKPVSENDICGWAGKHIGATSFHHYKPDDWTRLIQLAGWRLRKAREICETPEVCGTPEACETRGVSETRGAKTP